MRYRLVVAVVVGVLAASLLPIARADDSGASRIGVLDVTGSTVQASPDPTTVAGDGIGPGSPILVDFDEDQDGEPDLIGLCTANFVWQDASTGAQYLGAAGHCFLPSGQTEAEYDGSEVGSNQWVLSVRACRADCYVGGATALVSGALGAPGLVGDYVELGEVVYARQSADPAGEDAIGKDFGLVEIPADLVADVRPALPVWGGPTGTTAGGAGVPTCLYGNAAGFGETFATKARAGMGLPDMIFDDPGAWFGAIPSFQGDSGSAVIACDSLGGIGILTHLTANGVAGTTVGRAAFMAQEAGLSLLLVNGDGSTTTVEPVPYG